MGAPLAVVTLDKERPCISCSGTIPAGFQAVVVPTTGYPNYMHPDPPSQCVGQLPARTGYIKPGVSRPDFSLGEPTDDDPARNRELSWYLMNPSG